MFVAAEYADFHTAGKRRRRIRKAPIFETHVAQCRGVNEFQNCRRSDHLFARVSVNVSRNASASTTERSQNHWRFISPPSRQDSFLWKDAFAAACVARHRTMRPHRFPPDPRGGRVAKRRPLLMMPSNSATISVPRPYCFCSTFNLLALRAVKQNVYKLR